MEKTCSPKIKQDIRTHNQWQVLLDDNGNSSLDDMASSFRSTSIRVAQECLPSPPRPPSRSSKSTSQSNQSKKLYYLNQQIDKIGKHWNDSSSLYKHMHHILDLLNQQSSAIESQSSPSSLFSNQEWASYFGQLSADKTGHSRSPSHWHHQSPSPSPPRPFSFHSSIDPILNAPLTWKECSSTIRNYMANNKAPGIDSITTEWLKCATGNSPMAQSLWTLINRVWQEERLPTDWQLARIIPIPKKNGDLSLMDNYRGISLMSIVLKIICTLITKRLQEWTERNQLINKEQAGFRYNQECIGQATALYEILSRRRQAGKSTFVCFIDFCKAYDKVPHEALLFKLRNQYHLDQASPKCYNMIRALYDNPLLTTAKNPMTTDYAPILCGVRQGCPTSPILFNLFINDIMDEIPDHLGIDIPNVTNHPRCKGLLFADDTVLLANSPQDLDLMINHIQQWCQRWEMSINVKKCAIMHIQPSSTESTQPSSSSYTTIHQDIPIVKEYCYLGTQLTDTLDLLAMSQARANKGKELLDQRLNTFLLHKRIPLWIKRQAIMHLLIPTMTYGAELWSMNHNHTKPIRQVLDQAIAMTLSSPPPSPHSPTAIHNMQMELAIPDIDGICANLRFRAWIKYPKLTRSWIGLLTSQPAPICLWNMRTEQWIHRHLIPSSTLDHEMERIKNPPRYPHPILPDRIDRLLSTRQAILHDKEDIYNQFDKHTLPPTLCIDTYEQILPWHYHDHPRTAMHLSIMYNINQLPLNQDQINQFKLDLQNSSTLQHEMQHYITMHTCLRKLIMGPLISTPSQDDISTSIYMQSAMWKQFKIVCPDHQEQSILPLMAMRQKDRRIRQGLDLISNLRTTAQYHQQPHFCHACNKHTTDHEITHTILHCHRWNNKRHLHLSSIIHDLPDNPALLLGGESVNQLPSWNHLPNIALFLHAIDPIRKKIATISSSKWNVIPLNDKWNTTPFLNIQATNKWNWQVKHAITATSSWSITNHSLLFDPFVQATNKWNWQITRITTFTPWTTKRPLIDTDRPTKRLKPSRAICHGC